VPPTRDDGLNESGEFSDRFAKDLDALLAGITDGLDEVDQQITVIERSAFTPIQNGEALAALHELERISKDDPARIEAALPALNDFVLRSSSIAAVKLAFELGKTARQNAKLENPDGLNLAAAYRLADPATARYALAYLKDSTNISPFLEFSSNLLLSQQGTGLMRAELEAVLKAAKAQNEAQSSDPFSRPSSGRRLAQELDRALSPMYHVSFSWKNTHISLGRDITEEHLPLLAFSLGFQIQDQSRKQTRDTIAFGAAARIGPAALALLPLIEAAAERDSNRPLADNQASMALMILAPERAAKFYQQAFEDLGHRNGSARNQHHNAYSDLVSLCGKLSHGSAAERRLVSQLRTALVGGSALELTDSDREDLLKALNGVRHHQRSALDILEGQAVRDDSLDGRLMRSTMAILFNYLMDESHTLLDPQAILTENVIGVITGMVRIRPQSAGVLAATRLPAVIRKAREVVEWRTPSDDCPEYRYVCQVFEDLAAFAEDLNKILKHELDQLLPEDSNGHLRHSLLERMEELAKTVAENKGALEKAKRHLASPEGEPSE